MSLFKKFFTSHIKPGVGPVNFQAHDISPQALEHDVHYAIQVADNYFIHLPTGASFLKNRVVMEAGPGINFGTALIFACYHARVIVTDMYLAPWDENYHPALYSLLREKLSKERPGLDMTPLDTLIARGKYTPDIITCLSTPLEDLSVVSGESIDIIFSNAVIEHLHDPLQAFREMERITRHKGRGFHQVDFRDHRDFDRPLEHLLMNKNSFEELFATQHGECGNQYRHNEIRHFIEDAGFIVERFIPNMFASDSYLDEFIPRLRACEEYGYRTESRDILRVISGQFHMYKQ